jgi:hypothetical protein
MMVGFSGWMGSGKDTFSKMVYYQLLKRMNKKMPPYTQWELLYDPADNTVRFAGALKEIVAIITGVSVRSLESQSFKERELPEFWDRTINDAMEFLTLRKGQNIPESQEQLRAEATSFGFKWKRTYRELLQEVGTEVFRERFGQDIWVNVLLSRYKQPGYTYYPNWFIPDVRFVNEVEAIKKANGIVIRINRGERTSNHPSEASLDNYKDFDAIVENSGTLEELFEKASIIVDKFNLTKHADNNTRPFHDQEGCLVL